MCNKRAGDSGGPRRELVFLTPIVPASTGNGLAIRAGLQLEALSASFAVKVVVVPVAGGSSDTRWARRFADTLDVVELALEPPERAARGADLAGRTEWRRRLAEAAPLPHPAMVASPLLGQRVLDAAGASRQTPVHAFRSYLAPLAVAVGEALDAPWLTLDVDDDDEVLLARLGDEESARACGRLLGVFGPSFAWLSLASADEAAAVAARHGLPTVVLPNAVGIVDAAEADRGRHDGVGLLFVGNLTYSPNVEAAEELAREILPRVRALVAGQVHVELVGAFEPGGPAARLAELSGVRVTGYVDDLGDAYRRADVVVVPLRHAAGTRIKVLEALAWGVPVVTTSAGAAGLAVEHGRHLLVADDVDEIARAVVTVISDKTLAEALVREGRSLVETTYSRAAVGRTLRELVRL